MILVSVFAMLQRNEQMTWNGSHRVQHPWVVDTPAFDLGGDHGFALGSPVVVGHLASNPSRKPHPHQDP
jgi:hypothetical protein